MVKKKNKKQKTKTNNNNKNKQKTHLGQEDPLDKGTTTHFSIIAYRISWTEDSVWLWATGSQKV